MKKTTKADEAGQPMDPAAREAATAEPTENTKRVCYALRTLVGEVAELFPETPIEWTDYDGRNTALGVTFDLTANPDGAALGELLLLTKTDHRVLDVIVENGAAFVTMHSSARTQDLRDSFNLDAAYEVLVEGDEFGGSL